MRSVMAKLNIKKECFLAFSYALSAIITIVVYVTGGTNNVYSNFMYIPIAIVASTHGRKQGVIHAIINGILLGPFMPLDVALNISQGTVNWMLRLIIYAIIALVIGFFADYHRQEFEKSCKKDKELFEAQMATIYSLVKLSESRDDETGAHIERVAEFCKLLAENLRKRSKYQGYIDDNYVDKLSKASSLHDIGKVGIPDKILLKPGKLTPEEFEIMKSHTIRGVNTLLEVKKKYPDNMFLELGISITRYHHEKWDGTGYPDGLSGEEIPLSARIMMLVDVYDALRSKRVYKEAFSHGKSVDIIKEGKGKFFDPEIVDIFLEIEEQFKEIYEKYNS